MNEQDEIIKKEDITVFNRFNLSKEDRQKLKEEKVINDISKKFNKDMTFLQFKQKNYFYSLSKKTQEVIIKYWEDNTDPDNSKLLEQCERWLEKAETIKKFKLHIRYNFKSDDDQKVIDKFIKESYTDLPDGIRMKQNKEILDHVIEQGKHKTT